MLGTRRPASEMFPLSMIRESKHAAKKSNTKQNKKFCFQVCEGFIHQVLRQCSWTQDGQLDEVKWQGLNSKQMMVCVSFVLLAQGSYGSKPYGSLFGMMGTTFVFFANHWGFWVSTHSQILHSIQINLYNFLKINFECWIWWNLEQDLRSGV